MRPRRKIDEEEVTRHIHATWRPVVLEGDLDHRLHAINQFGRDSKRADREGAGGDRIDLPRVLNAVSPPVGLPTRLHALVHPALLGLPEFDCGHVGG